MLSDVVYTIVMLPGLDMNRIILFRPIIAQTLILSADTLLQIKSNVFQVVWHPFYEVESILTQLFYLLYEQ